MPTETQVVRAFGELGELLEAHEDGADLDSFAVYRDDPVGFVREVIGDEPWNRQREVMEAVRDHRNVAVRSCNAAGKTKLASWLLLWFCYARQGLGVVTANTMDQLSEQIMRRELWASFSKADPEFPGSLHVNAVRPEGKGRAGVVAKTATGVSALSGWHDTDVLFVIDEAQDHEKLDPHAWDAAFAVCTGEEDRKLALGNPLAPVGRFYRAHRPGSNWKSIRIPAADIPNIREGETVIPGLLTRRAIDDIATEYGEQSEFFRARVQAQFPEDLEEGLIKRRWLDAAAERFEDGDLHREAHEKRMRWRLAADIARKGKDATCVAIRRGNVLERFETWRGKDLEETADRIYALASDLRRTPFDPDPPVESVTVDAVAVGSGVYDNLAARTTPYRVREYRGSHKARQKDRYRNKRSEAYWKLSRLLADGKIALPDDEQLFEELLALRWRADGQGRVTLERKKDLTKRLGRSPDRADATAMVFYRSGSGGMSAEEMIVKY